MKTPSAFPYHLNWTSQDITDAVPLRLFQMIEFDARHSDAGHPVNVPARPAWRQHGYLRVPLLPDHIRVH